MADQNTDAVNGKRPFEERVFARFDAFHSAMRDTDSRLQQREPQAYDTKPIWELFLNELIETRRELSKRLDRIEAIAHATRAELRDAEDRLDRIESKLTQ